MAETWRSCPGHECCFEVSTNGRIRRAVPVRGSSSGYILAGSISRKGYRQVVLRHHGNQRTKKIAPLVARAFVGKPAPGYQINHRNGIKEDDSVANLEYVTASENVRHAFRLGLAAPLRGAAHPLAKLDERQVKAIRAERGRTSQHQLALFYGVSQTLISAIQRGVSWSHVGEER